MEYYVELKVGLRHGRWYDRLKQRLSDYNVSWQGGYYHITMAFINDMDEADADRLSEALGKCLSDRSTCRETFGRVEAFTTNNEKEHIVYLVPKVVSENLERLVGSVRECCSDIGIAIPPHYRHHITLGRINVHSVSLDKLQALTDTIHMPDFELRLDEVRLIRRADHEVVKLWKLT